MKCTQIKGIIVKNRTEGDNKGKESKGQGKEDKRERGLGKETARKSRRNYHKNGFF